MAILDQWRRRPHSAYDLSVNTCQTHLEFPMSDLTSRLERLLEFHDEAGSPTRAGLGPGLSDRELNKMEAGLGYPLLPEVREFMSWRTCVPDGIRLLPYPMGNWLQPNLVMQFSRSMEHLYWDELPDYPRPGDPIQMVKLFKGYAAIDHAEGPTKGGVFNTDGGAEGWIAPSFSRVVDVVLEYIDRGWIELIEGRWSELNTTAEAAAAEREAQFRADNPNFEGPMSLLGELDRLRIDVFDNPALSIHRARNWIW